MGKIITIAIAVFVGIVMMASVASIDGGGKFDYATADEERRQKYLENVASGFRGGFKIGAGKSAEITQTFTDASIDMISFSIQLKDERINNTPFDHIEKQRLIMLKKTCQQAANKKLLEYGITMRMRFYRPGGGKLMAIQVDEAACAKYIA
jgi:hypothetical protein